MTVNLCTFRLACLKGLLDFAKLNEMKQNEEIKVPLSLLVDIGSLFYALVNVFHPDWLIRSNFRLRRSDNLHKDSHQNSWIYPRVNRLFSPRQINKVFLMWNGVVKK